MNDRTREFIRGNQGSGPTGTPKPTRDSKPTKEPKQKVPDCGKCRKGKNCQSGICFKGKCVKSNSDEDKSSCKDGPPAGTCDESDRIISCVAKCIRK